LKPNNLTFNAQFNFCYPQPFQASDHSKNFGTKLSKIVSFSRSGQPTRFPGFTVQLIQKSRSPCRELAAFAAFPPLGFHRGGMDNLPDFFEASIESFDFFNTVVSIVLLFPLRGVQSSGFLRTVNQIFRFF